MRGPRSALSTALAACAIALAACAPARRVAPAAPSAAAPLPSDAPFPPRPADAPSGSRFLQAIRDADEEGRERAILRELLRGNIPSALRRLARVDFRAATASGRVRAVSLWVTPDYLAIGDDADSVRMPMSPITAQHVADALGFVLPTAKIVDVVYRNARIKLAPRPIPPSPWMVRNETFARHDAIVDRQLGRAGAPLLVAGHKKDLVLSNRLFERPHRLALYGWHELDGRPIQPLSTLHGDWYCDYSHGVRLVAGTMLIDGRRRRVADVLRHPELAALLSDEGPLAEARYRTDGAPGRRTWWPAIPAGEAQPQGKPAS